SDNFPIQTVMGDWMTSSLGVGGSLITNGDAGVLLAWGASNVHSWEPPEVPPPDTYSYGMVLTAGAGASSVGSPGGMAAAPVLQAQDGSFIGQAWDDSGNEYMIGFDQGGNLRWSVPNYYPLMATADGGVIATADYVSATTFDQNGNATGQMAQMPTQSWTMNDYQLGSVDQVVLMALLFAPSWSPFAGGNASGNGTAHFPIDSIGNDNVNKVLSPARWRKFAGSHCAAVFGDPVNGIASTMPNYSLQMVQKKQSMTNFYDVGNPGIGDLELRVVTGG